ncbi:MAG: Glu-tRNA(Gln) amidotransferase subunit GatE [Candidatus Aenigmatarchaeota archaeon]
MDYKKLGLKIGLEIHQQLNSRHKLFCFCPIIKTEEFPLSIERRLRVVPGELGDFDPAALHEYLRGKKFVYKFNTNSSCLVELDEDPPKNLNEYALRTALQICKMLNCNILDELHVMRKTVIDGSCVSGFQRTILIGLNGFLETSFGNVGIQTICLEEDSAPSIQKTNNIIEYRLDRLGIPLVEIATAPDMHSPEQAKEVAEKIGLLLRSVDVVRGIGSIRQDVNISIEGGARIEIKGFQELEKIEKLIENEVQRQISLIEIREELKKRGLKDIKSTPKDVTYIFKDTNCHFIRKIINDNGKVFALLLPKFSGLLRKQCGDRTFGKELSAYVEPFGFGGIIHSDEDLEKYKLNYEFDKLKELLKSNERDLILIIVGKENIEKAINSILDRAKACIHGVPEETRIADDIGSKYTRPLPGSGRLYPETDIQPIKITELYLNLIEIPKTLLEVEKELEKIMPKELANQIIRSKYYKDFEIIRKKYKINPIIIANTFLSILKDLSRRGFDTEKIDIKDIEKIFSEIEKENLSKDSLQQIFELIVQGESLKEIISKFKKISDDELRNIIKEIVKQNPGEKESVLMGILMKKIRGRADGEKIIKILREEMK